MPSEGDTFLPRIQSVFYAVFDDQQGPKIVFQVPESLIGVSTTGPTPNSYGTTPVSSSPYPSTPTVNESDVPLSRRSSSSLISLAGQRPNSRSLSSPQHRSTSSNRCLFNFDDISKYVIPRSDFCGRLIICATSNHRIIGFPVALRGRNYQRNYFRYNLCFVFERSADLSCYEPVVRKVSRVLTACEEESMFLSSQQAPHALYAILEQLYEDLNSYSETSIPIDKFNSIELKIFPFYPNPPPVKDWTVPLALINISKRTEENWDLTVLKVIKFIDGVNHVSRIAQLADCDLELTRQAISHLLYYQVIMTIDIFQYSNMYTLRKNVQWLADEAHVKEECGPYVTKPGRPIPDWPKLLHLYSRLKPGKTIYEWMDAYRVHELGIDVRRFASFGVIKGFLRRVHRWPVLLPAEAGAGAEVSSTRRRRQSFSSSAMIQGKVASSPEDIRRSRGQVPEISVTPISSQAVLSSPPNTKDNMSAIQAVRRTSAAETVLEQLRFKALQRSDSSSPLRTSEESQEGRLQNRPTMRRHSIKQQGPPSNLPGTINRSNSSNGQGTINGNPSPLPSRPRLSRSPSAPLIPQVQSIGAQLPSPAPAVPYPPELLPLLDGEHHTDELSTRFEAGWPKLQQWLVAAGGGKGDGGFGRVLIIYR